MGRACDSITGVCRISKAELEMLTVDAQGMRAEGTNIIHKQKHLGARLTAPPKLDRLEVAENESEHLILEHLEEHALALMLPETA